MNETILCAITWNKTGWTTPYERTDDDPIIGDWVKNNRFGGEDWLFNTAPEQQLNGKLYTYAQAEMGPDRVQASHGVFNVFFYTKAPGGEARLVGLYRNAEYILRDDEEGSRTRAFNRLQRAGINKIRAEQLRAGFSTPAAAAAAIETFRSAADLSWIVSPDDVHTFGEGYRITAPSWRVSNAHFVDKLSHKDQNLLARLLYEAGEGDDLEDAGFPRSKSFTEKAQEGQRRQRLHLRRERSSALVTSYRKRRALAGPPEHWTCDACDTTLVAEHGPFARNGFDVHHQVPLHQAGDTGRVTNTDELCILCVRCHRLAHASNKLTVNELRQFLSNPTGSP
jgi:predicted HNH restriction endonuclease